MVDVGGYNKIMVDPVRKRAKHGRAEEGGKYISPTHC